MYYHCTFHGKILSTDLQLTKAEAIEHAAVYFNSLSFEDAAGYRKRLMANLESIGKRPNIL